MQVFRICHASVSWVIMKCMEFKTLVKKALTVGRKYDEQNANRGVYWDAQDLMSGFVGDVGDLSKLIMAKYNLREIDDVDKKLAHELADCLWSIIMIANKLDINLEAEFENTMNELEARLSNKS